MRGLNALATYFSWASMPYFFNAVDDLLPPFYLIDEQLFDIPADRLYRVENTYHKVLIMLRGECQMSIDARPRIRFSTGDIFIFNQVCVQDYFPVRFGQACRLHILRLLFDPKILPPVGSNARGAAPGGDATLDPTAFIGHYLSVTDIVPGGLTSDIEECLAKIRAESENRLPGYRAAVSALCLLLLVLIGRKRVIESPIRPGKSDRGYANVIGKSKSYILANLSKPLSLSEVAWHVGWSEEHFSRVFRSVAGQTPAQYIRQLRLEHAKNLLLNSKHSITDIARISGFSSHSIFSRCFQHNLGMSPTAYREEERFGRVV